MKNKILERNERVIQKNKPRVSISQKGLEVLGITEENNKVIVTVYEDKIVITKGDK